MKVVELTVDVWRNFRNISIQVPEETALVCLVGENGTGKSNLLELISASAHKFGISPGISAPRGDPFSDIHSFQVRIRVPDTIEQLLPVNEVADLQNAGVTWDGTLGLKSTRGANGACTQEIEAGGVGDKARRIQLGNRLASLFSQSQTTNYLCLDADRAYPPLNVNANEYAQALEQDWELPQWVRQRAYLPTKTMYDDWTKYFLATEGQIATKYVQRIRKAKEAGAEIPPFEDCFSGYKESVKKVLPHLEFTGVNTKQKAILFDTSGLELKFSSLSGGEKEIAFIIGQIERFKLRDGLLMIDEPELHLNPDLLRNWIAYLKDTIVTGQVWISTHSLEAVEAAGPDSTFVLERTSDTRLVEKVEALSNKPVLSVLSAAVGSPAFSLRNLRFVYIEGDRQGREKERFYRLYGDARFVRFIEGGGCDEVTKKLSAVRELAEDADEQLKAGGVIDRDFRTEEQIAEKVSRTPVHVLGCHEIENLFLHPGALQRIAERSVIQVSAVDLLREASDQFAGLWVLARAVSLSSGLTELNKQLRKKAAQLSWKEIEIDRNGVVDQILQEAINTGDTTYEQLRNELLQSVAVYESVRGIDDLWKICMGKETLRLMPAKLGLRSTEVLENNVLEIWKNNESMPPQELVDLQSYINSIN